MMEPGQKLLTSLQTKWKTESFVYCALLALTIGLPAATFFHILWGWPFWTGIGITAVADILFLYLLPYWRLSLSDITRYLNRQLPQLEESSELLLRPSSELGPLELLQVTRVQDRLAVAALPHPLRKKLLWAGGGLLLAAALSLGIQQAALAWAQPKVLGKGPSAIPAVPEKAAPGIRSVDIRITPPAYTGHVVRSQPAFSIQAEEGAVVSWELTTSAAVDTLQFIFNDTARLSLQVLDREHTRWRLTRAAMQGGFYQVKVGGSLSELYKFEVIKDEPPRITIERPKAYSVIDYGEGTKIPLVVRLNDDYGIGNAEIRATVASGKGEAVKFSEQTLPFDGGIPNNQSSLNLHRTLDLGALGLKPGDELYFYCRAKDNHGQEARTNMYIISLADTAQLMSLSGMTVGVDIKPELFRSERQIIIETEQLLKEKDTIPELVFKNKCNDLGLDQKLLRLRYGKFLGEEAEEGGGSAPGDKQDFGAFGDATKILDAFTDKHDNAEDATFFEPKVKEQLKATLTEMWGAELRLRTFKPLEALPYAYKALRLLKDLQQQSRAYVAKTGVRLTPLDPAKRLTGKLQDIGPRVQQGGHAGDLSEEDRLRIVLGLLDVAGASERTGTGAAAGRIGTASTGGRISSFGAGSLTLLQEAVRRLGREAAAHPGEYLTGYQSLRRILDESGSGPAGMRSDSMAGRTAAPGDILLAQQAIRRLLPPAEANPFPVRRAADDGLSQLYFNHINDRGQ